MKSANAKTEPDGQFGDQVETIPGYESGEFVEACPCGGCDFFTVSLIDGVWVEIEPVVRFDGWGCISCNRVFNEDGVRIARPSNIEFAN